MVNICNYLKPINEIICNNAILILVVRLQRIKTVSIKIAFNNFKPFNENYQTIVKKSIILVYGPNSAGKSSLIDALLYYNYLKLADAGSYGNEKYLNISNKYFAGDKVSLGGFKSFVHKKDISRVITFETTYDKNEKEVFEKLIPDYKEYSKLMDDLDIFLGGAGHADIHQLIVNKISDKNKDDSSEEKEKIEEDVLDKIIAHYSLLRLKILGRYHSRTLKEEDAVNIEEFIQFLTNISKIKSLKIVRKIGDKEGKVTSELDIYIDDSKLFTYTALGWSDYYVIRKESFFEPIIHIHNRLGKKILFDSNGLYKFKKTLFQTLKSGFGSKNFLINYSSDLIRQVFSSKYSYSIQYIGPLRLVPSKDDLFHKGRKVQVNYIGSLIQRQYDRSRKVMSILDNNTQTFHTLVEYTSLPFEKLTIFVGSKVEKIKHYIGIKKFIFKVSFGFLSLLLLLLTIIPFLIILLSSILFFSIYIIFRVVIQVGIPQIIENSIVSLNHTFFSLFSKTKTLSTLGAVTTERMWLDFVSSEKIQKEVDLWLGNARMKSHYKVNIDTVESSWIQKLFHMGTMKKLNFIDMKTGTKVYPDEMGTGISQVLPILISAKMREKSNIFIEQPELHLHPALQAELADEFILSAKKRNNSFVMETHSEHLLLRMMKRMRQTYEGTIEDENLKLTSDDISLLYVDTDGENTFILELELDEDGTLLDQWPGGFFEEGFNERFF